MRKIYIKYDPYEMKSILLVDGKEMQKNKHCDVNLKKFLDASIHMPIQSWIDPIERDGWKGLLETLCLMGDKDIVVEFAGRRIDYESIQAALIAQNENRKLGAKLQFCELEEEIIPDVKMKENVAEVIRLMLTKDFEEIVNDSSSSVLIKKYQNLKKIYEEIDGEEFRIVFTGTYSSGKSSTINALIGKNLLPTASGTCTSKICRIIHEKGQKYFAKVKYCYKGKVKEFVCMDENAVQEKIKAVEDAVEQIEVYTDLSDLYPKDIQNDFKLVLVDTPGTDSAVGNDTEKTDEGVRRLSKKSHIEITKEVLQSKQKEMVVLISDDKLEDDNIVELLDIIEDSAEQDEGAFNDRFLFVMNMCDSLSYSNRGETLENYVKNFIANIKKVPHSSRIRNIVNPRVFPITSGAALAIVNGYTEEPGIAEGMTKKAELYGYYENFCKRVYYYAPQKLENHFKDYIAQIKDQYANYHNFCLEEQSAVSEAVKYGYIQSLEGEMELPERLMIHTGIPALGTAIREYIRSYAYPLKVRQLLGCFTDILTELIALNDVKYEALDEAKKSYSDVVFRRELTEVEKESEEKRRGALIKAKENMESVKGKVDSIPETVPEINEIRAKFYLVKNGIAEELSGRTEVLETEGIALISSVNKRLEKYVGEVDILAHTIKKNKRVATEALYNRFIASLQELEKSGLMDNGSFSLKDTVEYQQLVDKAAFVQPEYSTKVEKNSEKSRWDDFEWNDFFGSIERIWKTRKLPDTIQKRFINIDKYVSDNISPVEANVDRYVTKLQNDYRDDIVALKRDTKDRMGRVLALIQEKNVEINKMKAEASKIAADELSYAKQIKKLEETKSYLELLVNKIIYTQI